MFLCCASVIKQTHELAGLLISLTNGHPLIHSTSLSLHSVPVICLEWPSTQLASALDEVQEPAIQASFGLQMSNFFRILVVKTNGCACL